MRTIATPYDLREIAADLLTILGKYGVTVPMIVATNLVEVELIGRLFPALGIDVGMKDPHGTKRLERDEFEDILARCARAFLSRGYRFPSQELLGVLAMSVASVLKRSGVDVATPLEMRPDTPTHEAHAYWKRFAEAHRIPAA